MPTFAAKQVCAALGVSHGTLNSWAHAGYFRQFDAAVTRPGRARKFSFHDLLRLLLQTYFLDFDISPRKAWTWSQTCADYMKELCPTQIKILSYSDSREEILLDDQEPGPGAIVLSLTIYPKTIDAELRRRLAATDDTKMAAMSRHRSAGVSAGRRPRVLIP